MRLDAVEIKATVGRAFTARAMESLGLDPDDGLKRRIWFCEVPAGGPEGEPVLLGRGVILRLRETEGKAADSTVKLRPIEPPPLVERWRKVGKLDDGELRVEGDWVVGGNQVVSASLVAAQDDDEPTEVAEGRRPLKKVFSHEQEDFLDDHAVPRVDLDALRPLGPIAALKWEPRDRGLPRRLAAELWKIDDLEFLELSVRAGDVDDAVALQHRLETALDDRGLLIDPVTTTKTRAVLQHLVRRPS